MSMLSLVTAACLIGQLPTGPAPRGGIDARWSADASGVLRNANGVLGRLENGPSGAIAFVRARSKAFGVSAEETLSVTEDALDEHGNRHVRIARFLHDVRVELDEIRLHARPDGQVHAIEAEISSFSPPIHQPPSFPPEGAINFARGGFGGRLIQHPSVDLVYLGAPGTSMPARLAYRVRIAFERSPNEVPFISDVYVDARSGRTLKTLSRVYTDGTPGTVTSNDLFGTPTSVNVTSYMDATLLKDSVTLPQAGDIFTLDGSRNGVAYQLPNAMSEIADPEAVSVASNVKRALDFYANTFGFRSWNFATAPSSAGGLLAGIAHVGTMLNNAYFTTATDNGHVFGLMNYGDGDSQSFVALARCFDVSGHELGHGVVAGTANLIYENQSGALNEHFADTFGWLMDQRNDTIGEDCVGPMLQPALRNMCDPGAVPIPQPAHMSDYRMLPDTEDGDHGGVHANSGIPNKAVCTARNAIGADKVGRVWYQTLTHHLGPTSTFIDMVNGTAASCTELGLSSSDCAAIAGGWTTVGLAAAQSGGMCPANSSANGNQCVCDAGFRPAADGASCEMIPPVSCPPNAHDAQGQCYCDAGYAPSADGMSCVGGDPRSAPCPAHSHREQDQCVCDPCFQGATSGDSAGCTATPSCAVCSDPLQVSVNGQCGCIAGIMTDGNGQCRTPILDDCGNETYAGRCVGDVLIYCDDRSAPPHKAVSALDCTMGNETCAVDPSGEGFNCVQKASSCGDVPVSGKCNGNVASYCSDGVPKTFDCGDHGCGPFTYMNVAVEFCHPCPPNATLNADSTCTCDQGYAASADGQSCVMPMAPIMDPAGGGGNGSKGGCTCVQAEHARTSGGWFFAVLLGVSLIALKRSSRAGSRGRPSSRRSPRS